MKEVPSIYDFRVGKMRNNFVQIARHAFNGYHAYLLEQGFNGEERDMLEEEFFKLMGQEEFQLEGY